MFHPLLVTIALLLIWREAEHQVELHAAKAPVDVVTPDVFRAGYARLVATATFATVWASSVAVLGMSLEIREPPVFQVVLAMIGFAGAWSVKNASEQVATLFCRLEASGRHEGRELRDYMPSMVLFPLMPA